ncbi:MAG: hypothetical protein ACTSRE_02290 [Promethearchaeota archaeon]
MPTYCQKCGKSLSESTFGDLCETCSDLDRRPSHRLFTRRVPVKRYSMRDGAITFIIIIALLVVGLVLLGGFN